MISVGRYLVFTCLKARFHSSLTEADSSDKERDGSGKDAGWKFSTFYSRILWWEIATFYLYLV